MSSKQKRGPPEDADPDNDAAGTRGILNPGAEGRRYQLARLTPAKSVASFVDRYWSVRWQFSEGETYLTETLPFPCVNVVFEAGRALVNGICTRRWSRTLAGEGRVFGVRFRPGAFAPFFARPIHALTDRVVPFASVFEAGTGLEKLLLAADDDADRARLFEAFLSARLPEADAERERVTQVVDLALATKGLRRVPELADAAHVSARTLQRLFRRYLGVTPKWTLCRFRIQEAAQRAAAGDLVDWSALALELGYADQAHFITDFKAQIGKTPSAYAAFTRAQRG